MYLVVLAPTESFPSLRLTRGLYSWCQPRKRGANVEASDSWWAVCIITKLEKAFPRRRPLFFVFSRTFANSVRVGSALHTRTRSVCGTLYLGYLDASIFAVRPPTVNVDWVPGRCRRTRD